MHTTEYELASLLYHPMPALEMLLLSFWADGNDGDDELEPIIPDQQEDEEGDPIRYPFFWFPEVEQFPNIIDLSLGRTVAFSLHMPVLPTLKRLELTYCTILGDIRLKESLEYVRKHPLLEELSLCRVRIPHPHPQHRPLTLPLTLRKFSLEDFTSYVANFVWMLAPLPADLNIHLMRRIRYSGPDFESETPLSATYCLQHDRSNLPILTLVESIIVRQTWCEVYNLIGRTPTGTTITLRGQIPEDLLKEYDFLGDLVDVFGSAPVKELRVEGHERHKMTTDHWTRALLAFSRLRRIAVTDTALEDFEDEPGLNACATLLEVLRRDPVSSDVPLLCSELDSLELVTTNPDKDAQFAKELSELLTFRAEHDKPIKYLRIILRSLCQ